MEEIREASSTERAGRLASSPSRPGLSARSARRSGPDGAGGGSGAARGGVVVAADSKVAEQGSPRAAAARLGRQPVL